MSRFVLPALAAHFLSPVAVWCQIGIIVVGNGASLRPGLPPNGSIGTVFCTGLTVSGFVSAQGFPLPTTVAGVTVTVRGVPAPLFAVADLGFGFQRVDFQVPQEFGSYPPEMNSVLNKNGVQAFQ